MSRGPVVIVQKYESDASRVVTSNAYRDLRIHALPGLHDLIGKLCVTHFRESGRVVDLAAGSGAMSRRLLDLGFSPIAVDYVSANFKAPEISFVQVDLNQRFADTLRGYGAFDGIVASEIIEHLENPFGFLRECSELLSPGGKLILSTPNVNSSASVANYARTGEFLWFSSADRSTHGHISPLTQWQLRFAVASAGFQIDWEGSFGCEHSRLRRSPRLTVLTKLIDVLSSIPASLRGEVYLCVASKK